MYLADRRTEGFSGADLAGLSRDAAIRALKESMAKEVTDAAAAAVPCLPLSLSRPLFILLLTSQFTETETWLSEQLVAGSTGSVAAAPFCASVEPRHFEEALSNTFPSVSARDRKAYAGLKKKLGRCVPAPLSPPPPPAPLLHSVTPPLLLMLLVVLVLLLLPSLGLSAGPTSG